MAYDRIHSRESGGDFIETLQAFTSKPISPDQVFARGSVSPCDWLMETSYLPASGVLTLQGGSTLTFDCWTLTGDLRWIYDCTNLRDTRHHGGRSFQPPQAKSRIVLEGRGLDLGSNWCSKNYGHWLLDAVGRLATLEGSGCTLQDFDHIRLPVGKFNQCAPVLELLGISNEKLVLPDGPSCLIQFDELVRPQVAGAARVYHPRLGEFFQSKMGPRADGPEKVYLKRTGRRGLTTQPEIEMALKSRGFEIVDPATAPFGSWSSARILIASHSAGMADLAFCRPGLKILELFSPSWQRPYFHSLAQGAGHDYWCIIGHNETGGHEDVDADFMVPVRQVIDWLDHVEQ
jgi:capsular polysaccharide biosynthesis protein